MVNKKDQTKEEFEEYTKNFIQRVPRYAVKLKGPDKTWVTKNKALSDRPVKAHLNGQYYVGVYGKWYPGFAIVDIDDADKDRVDEIREKLRLDTDNSMLMGSESKDSYHLLFKPSYKHKPPTIRLLNDILKPFANENNIEIYPQANRPIRLPFGPTQKMKDCEFIHLDNWKDKLYWFAKLDYLDLKGIPYQQMSMDLDVGIDNGTKLSTYYEGQYLFEQGLLEKHSRHDSQYRVLYYIWRQNIPLEIAIDMTWNWIKAKHNNRSTDILNHPQRVKNEIIRQARWVYSKNDFIQLYPDEIHNSHKGFITKEDIVDIFMICRASKPKSKFLFNLVKYCYPRRYNIFIRVHSKNFEEWSKGGYMGHLKALQAQGIVKRYDSYQADVFAKSIKINWKFKDPRKAILVDCRAPELFDDTIRACFTPEELREILIKSGSERTAAIKTVKRMFDLVAIKS